MRISFPDLSRPKAAAKLLSRLSNGVTLSSAHEATARAAGYRDWHELAQASPASVKAGFDLGTAKQVVLGIADRLELLPGDVQYAVAKARLLGSGPWALDDHLALTTSVWRERQFGVPARGKPGTVIKVRAHGEIRPAYLGRSGRPSYVVYDTGPGMCADFEVVTPRSPLPDFVPSRLWLPYGYWTLRDGSEVIFARDYLPIWRVSGGIVERLDPWLWIEGIEETTVFSSRLGTVVWSRGPAREQALEHLAQRRIFELPRLVEAMPHLVGPDVDSVEAGVARLHERVGAGSSFPAYARLNSHIADIQSSRARASG